MDLKEGHEELQALAAGYVLGVLEPDEAAAFARHLASCSDCLKLVAELRGIVDVLPLAVEQVEPPPSLRARVLEAVRTEAKQNGTAAALPARARRGLLSGILARPMAWAAAVVLLLAALGATTGWAFAMRGSLDSSQARVSSLYDAMTVLAQADRRWQISGSSIDPSAHGVLAYSSQQHAAMLIMWGLPQATGARTYNAWTVANGTRQGMGQMHQVDDGIWALMPGDVTTKDGVGITLRDPTAPPGQQSIDVVNLHLSQP